MRKSLLALCASLLLLETAVAEVNYREFRIRSWGYRAEDCGEIYQGYVVYKVEYLLANLKDEMWARARELGAREDEIEALEKRFETGRRKAMDRTFNQDPSEDFQDIGVMMLKGDRDWNFKYCTNTLGQDDK